MSKVLLLEPNYKNKYPPMGLMKLATYYRQRGEDVRFFKGNLKDLAAGMLCEAYLLEVQNSSLAQHETKLFEYIKTGKYAPIDAIDGFRKSDNGNILSLYREKYVKGKYPKFDIICVTTLFTFYWKETVATINNAKGFLKKNGKILVGGISASLLSKQLEKETGITPQVGLLNKAGMLNADSNVIIDELPLDYSILEEIDYQYPASNAYFAYMTRGCPNHCSFCAVPKLEPEYCHYISLKSRLECADSIYGVQKDLLLMDNNVFASDCFNKIINEIKECGFEKGATYIPSNEYDTAYKNVVAPKKEQRNIRAYTKKIVQIYDLIAEKLTDDEEKAGQFYALRNKSNLLFAVYAKPKDIKAFDEIARPLYEKYFKRAKRTRYIDFNQGVDARLVTDEKMSKLSEINIRPLRIAFDHYTPKMVEEYVQAIELAAKYKINDLSNYLLYNFMDKPEDLYERMKINVELCEKLGVTIYSFPMKYHPIDDPDFFHNRDYIGKHWNRKFIRAIQAVLNATKGKIGRGKSFFEEAFGRDINEFQKLLWMPETFIIYRRKYNEDLRNNLAEKYKGHYDDESNLANEWWEAFSSLNNTQLEYVKSIVANNKFSDDICKSDDAIVQKVLNYYKVKRES